MSSSHMDQPSRRLRKRAEFSTNLTAWPVAEASVRRPVLALGDGLAYIAATPPDPARQSLKPLEDDAVSAAQIVRRPDDGLERPPLSVAAPRAVAPGFALFGDGDQRRGAERRSRQAAGL